MPHSMSDLGMACLPMSHKKDDRLIWVNATNIKNFTLWLAFLEKTRREKTRTYC